MPTVRFTLGFTAVCLVGCQDTSSTEVDSQVVDEPAHVGGLPTPAALPTPVDGKLVERIVPVKLPSTDKVKEGKAAEFRFGRESEHTGWVAQLPEHAQLVTVAYGGGKIFVGGGFGSNSMYALNAATGAREWTRQSLVDPGPTSAVVDDQELAYNTYSCTMEVLQTSTGKVLWTKWLGTETPNPPAFSGNLVIASHPSEGGYQLSAYKRKNGNDVWSSAIDNHILSVPVVVGDSVYVSTASGSLYKIGLDGKRAWIFHGDVFDVVTKHSRWLARLGGVGYDLLILINRAVNRVSMAMGRGRISLSKRIKDGVKSAVSFIGDFEKTTASMAIEEGFDYVLCGHIHQPVVKEITTAAGRVLYMNSGDWIENLTALEFTDGRWSIFRYREHEEELELPGRPEDGDPEDAEDEAAEGAPAGAASSAAAAAASSSAARIVKLANAASGTDRNRIAEFGPGVQRRAGQLGAGGSADGRRWLMNWSNSALSLSAAKETSML